MPQISACIITRDEEHHIGACLETLSFCDEVVVLDCGSKDATVEEARARGARVIETDWPGMIEQKNRAVAQALNDWVLCVDADERVSLPLVQAIQQAVRRVDTPSCHGYALGWRTIYLGGPVRSDHGRARWKLRLYDRRRGRWIGREPHGHVEIEGEVERLGGDLLHYTYRDLDHHVAKMNPYTEAAARELLPTRRSPLLGMLVRAPWAFLRSYVFRGGFRDGFRGYVVARMAAAYVFLKYAKLYEFRLTDTASEPRRPSA